MRGLESETIRIYLVCNPASGGATSREEISALLEEQGATLVGEPDAERIVVSGGDGTIGEAAALAARLDVPLGVVPTGTANDFARSAGLPEDLAAAAAVAVRGAPGRPRDLARIDGRPFVNVAAAGLAPAAAARAEPMKRALGALAYPVGAVLAGVREDPIAVRIPGHFDGDAWQVIVACSGAFGGGAEIEAADPHDGQLDLVVIPESSRAELARRAVHLRRGDVADAPGTVHARAARLTLHVPDRTAFNVDGELVEAGPVAELTVRERFRLASP